VTIGFGMGGALDFRLLSWHSVARAGFADISRFGGNNSRLRGGKFPIGGATGICSQRSDPYGDFGAAAAVEPGNLAKIPVEPGILPKSMGAERMTEIIR
jgi:hypothetical protein